MTPPSPLLFESAKPYYTATRAARRARWRCWRRCSPSRRTPPATTAARLPTSTATLVGVVAGFPVAERRRLSRRFIQLTLPKLPPWRWLGTFRHLRAAGNVAPAPAAGRLLRRRARGRPGLAPARHRPPAARRRPRQARAPGCTGLALDTGLQNARRARLYEAYGFGEREIRRAPNDRTARALGGPGFVGYLKAV